MTYDYYISDVMNMASNANFLDLVNTWQDDVFSRLFSQKAYLPTSTILRAFRVNITTNELGLQEDLNVSNQL